MNWIFTFILAWHHPPLEVPPLPPTDWPKYEAVCCDWSNPYIDASRYDSIFLSPSREVLRVKTTYISMPFNGGVIVLVTPEQMAILESSYPKERVHCDLDVIFYAP